MISGTFPAFFRALSTVRDALASAFGIARAGAVVKRSGSCRRRYCYIIRAFYTAEIACVGAAVRQVRGRAQLGARLRRLSPGDDPSNDLEAQLPRLGPAHLRERAGAALRNQVACGGASATRGPAGGARQNECRRAVADAAAVARSDAAVLLLERGRQPARVARHVASASAPSRRRQAFYHSQVSSAGSVRLITFYIGPGVPARS